MSRIKKKKSIQRTIYVPEELNEKFIKYLAESNKSYSEAVCLAIQSFLKIHANKDELSITTEIIENCIRKELKPTTERIIKFLAKATKSGYSSLFLQGQVLAYLFDTDDKNTFLKEALEKAEALGYKALRNYSLDGDIEKMFPKSLRIEDFE